MHVCLWYVPDTWRLGDACNHVFRVRMFAEVRLSYRGKWFYYTKDERGFQEQTKKIREREIAYN